MQAQHQRFEIGVKAVIVQDGRVLLLKRRDFQTWDMPGGRINEGETVGQALAREVCEELPGGQCQTSRHIVHAEMADFVLPNGLRLMLLFFRVDAALPNDLQASAEHDELRWARASDLEPLAVAPHFTRAALMALATGAF